MPIPSGLLPFSIITLACFLSGSLMFSCWLARIAGRDITRLGDRNPGAVNALQSAGRFVGATGLLLDFLKGFLPLFILTRALPLSDFRLTAWALAPVLGHCFSPFLRFRGGKGVAVTFGIWSGLTLWEAPVVLGAVFLVLKFLLPRLLRPSLITHHSSIFTLHSPFFTRIPPLSDRAIVIAGMVGLFPYLAFRHPAPALFLLLTLNLALLVHAHWRQT